MMRMTRTATVLRVAATFALTLALAACGGISETSSGSPAGLSAALATVTSPSTTSSDTTTPAATTASTATTPQPTAIAFSADEYSVAQQSGSVSLTVTRTGTMTAPASVSYSTTDGSAVGGMHYQAVTGTLEWAENDSTSKTISVPVSSASAFSGDKTFGVTLSHPSAATSVGNPGTATITIAGSADSASTTVTGTAKIASVATAGSVRLSTANYSIGEDGKSVALTVLRTGSSRGAVSVGYTTTNVTASAGTDFAASHGVLEWADGDATAKTFSVAILAGRAFTGTKQFQVSLVNPRSGVALSNPSQASVTITGATAADAGNFHFSATAFYTKQSASSVVVWVRRADGATGAASVSVKTAPRTAAAGVDYKSTSAVLNWANGDKEPQTVTVPLLATKSYSGTRTFQVVLSAPSAHATVGNPGSAMVTIDGGGSAAVGSIALSAASYAIAQNGGPLKVTVNRTGGSNGAISVAYAEIGKSAVAGQDFTAASGTLRWSDGDEAAKTLTIGVSNATPFAGSKSFGIVLSGPTGGAALSSPSKAVATINGDATASVGSFALSAATYPVLQSGGSLDVTVHRAGGSAGAVSVAYATANGGAVAGTDYTATSGTLRWADGDSDSKTFSIPVSNATPFSGTKSFGISISGPSGGATLSSPENASATITGSRATQSAPAGNLHFSGSGYTVDQTTGTLNVTVNRTGGSAGATSLTYATLDDTAVAGTDYSAARGTLQWADGDSGAKQFAVHVSAAKLFSGSKAFNIALSSATGGATISAPSSATVTIDGDAQAAVGQLELATSAATVAQNGGAANLTVNRTGGSAGAVSVAYATSNGSAAAGTDYMPANGTLQWADGDAASKTVAVAISDATPFTGSKSFTVALSNPTAGASLSNPSTAAVTINGSAVTSPPPPAGTLWVYHNGVFNWPGDYSWNATINYKDTAGGPLSGATDIAVSIVSPWGGFQPFAFPSGGTPFDTRPYKYLIYSVKPTIPNQVYSTGIDANNDVADGTPINIVGVPGGPPVTKYGPTPVVGQWGSYKIPIADFGLTNPLILKFSIADGTGVPTNRFYVDDVGFTTQ